jgi:pimeloyl-ACP methyl ester carboxylesterase
VVVEHGLGDIPGQAGEFRMGVWLTAAYSRTAGDDEGVEVARSLEVQKVTIHGHQRAFVKVGSGPALLLLHGLGCDHTTWLPVIDQLARRYTVIAPDLLGHGESAKPRGDYSLGAYASGIRDLLVALGHDRATVVGHSLGGGIAMQFAYQFPERLDRLVLVASGGLGREVSPLIRAATLPLSEWVLPLLVAQPLRDGVSAVHRALGRVGLRPGSDLREVARGFASLGDIETRQAFIHTIRGIVEPAGQRVSATDRLYLAAGVPTLIVWGERDPIIPVAHAQTAHEAMPGSRLELFPGSGHFPQLDNPLGFYRVLQDFLDSTEPADLTVETVRDLLLEGAAR